MKVLEFVNAIDNDVNFLLRSLFMSVTDNCVITILQGLFIVLGKSLNFIELQ